MGFAYNANYFRWFEIGRTELLRSFGLTYKAIETKGLFLPVSEAFCKYIAPVIYDDMLQIETALDTHIKGGMKFDYTIFSEDGKKILAKGYTKHACVDRNGRVVRPPEFLVKLITSHATPS
ncbi:MAG: thioesterase [Desulfobacter sp.]|jgi:acyl-CoA thioester hydrolase|nr:thioesterase [Desulfobacter sp.]|tara:strand:- start:3154 stop:3516 length:363 start_codon:yes stop_codon:yes gene_type:complete